MGTLLATVMAAALLAAPAPGRLAAEVEQVVKAVQAGDFKGATRRPKAWGLPGPEAWFRKAFGDEAGPRLATAYAPFAAHLASEEGIRELAEPLRDGRSTVEVVEVKATGTATRWEDKLLARLKAPVTLYRVRLVRAAAKDSFFDLGYFAEVDGQWRALGDLREKP
jgi:hypothetical protein